MSTPQYQTHSQVYEPAEDTFLLLDAIESDASSIRSLRPLLCMEIGCGTGLATCFLSKILLASSWHCAYLATDVNRFATELAYQTALENDEPNVCCVQTDIAQGLTARLAGRVDICMCNPPYVPTHGQELEGSVQNFEAENESLQQNSWQALEKAWAGGADGREVIDRILRVVSRLLSQGGIFYLVALKANKIDELLKLGSDLGRFGNQAEHFLGGMAFAKALNRTLIVPPWRTNRNVEFDEWFNLSGIADYHRAILAKDFMRNLSDLVWRPENRLGFCYQPQGAEPCKIKIGNPFTNFWDELGVEFTQIIGHALTYHEVPSWKILYRTGFIWYPPDQFPVLALRAAPASFPMYAEHVSLQAYLRFSDAIQAEVNALLARHFEGSRDYVAVHLRNGEDWVKACELVDSAPRLMASYQCVGFDYPPAKKLTHEMCFPSADTVLNLTERIVRKENVKFLLVATDRNPMIAQFTERLPDVKVVHVDPWLPVVDAALLSESKHFIGNCVSSFSAFVWRHRRFHGKGETSHFGVEETTA